MTKFSDWLNEQIQRKGIGINQLALYTGLSPSTISKARLDQRRPEPETVSRLAKYFQVDEDWLLAVAGHRSGAAPEQEWSKVQNPELRALLTPENINNLSPAAQRSLIAILQAELEYQQRSSPDKTEASSNPDSTTRTTPPSGGGNGRSRTGGASSGTVLRNPTTNSIVLTLEGSRSWTALSYLTRLFSTFLTIQFWLLIAVLGAYTQLLISSVSWYTGFFHSWRSQEPGGEVVIFFSYCLALWLLPTIIDILLLPITRQSIIQHTRKYGNRFIPTERWLKMWWFPAYSFMWLFTLCTIELSLKEEQQLR